MEAASDSTNCYAEMWPLVTDLWKRDLKTTWCLAKMCTCAHTLACTICLSSWVPFLGFLSTYPPHPVLSKLNFRRSHNVVYFYLRCEFHLFLHPCQGGCIFNHVSNSEMGFVSQGKKNPRIGVNSWGVVPSRHLVVAPPRWLTSRAGAAPPGFEGTPRVLPHCPRLWPEAQAHGCLRHTPGSGSRFRQFPRLTLLRPGLLGWSQEAVATPTNQSPRCCWWNAPQGKEAQTLHSARELPSSTGRCSLPFRAVKNL